MWPFVRSFVGSFDRGRLPERRAKRLTVYWHSPHGTALPSGGAVGGAEENEVGPNNCRPPGCVQGRRCARGLLLILCLKSLISLPRLHFPKGELRGHPSGSATRPVSLASSWGHQRWLELKLNVSLRCFYKRHFLSASEEPFQRDGPPWYGRAHLLTWVTPHPKCRLPASAVTVSVPSGCTRRGSSGGLCASDGSM